MEFKLNIFTLNCWGIPLISKNRKERFQAIAKYLQRGLHSIVCLQEVWSEKDYLYLKDALQSVLPYSHYFYSGVLGSGLCVFSKWLIQDVFFHQWPLNGYIHKIHHGDWFGGKGIGLCRIKIEDRIINVYCTHLHAEYHVDDIYLAHRVLQAHSTAEFVNLTAAPADVSILAGDLNATPDDLSFKIISQLPPLTDPVDNKEELEGTSDNQNNSYSDRKQVKICPKGKRIDHILYKVNPTLEVEVLNYGNPLPDRVPDQPFSYSDHNAVTLELLLKPADLKVKQQNSVDPAFDDTVQKTITVCKEAMADLNKSKKLFLMFGGIIFFLLISSVVFWRRHNLIYDVIKIIFTGLCFYYVLMGTLWNRIEMNSLKAGISALENYSKTRNKPEKIEDVKTMKKEEILNCD